MYGLLQVGVRVKRKPQVNGNFRLRGTIIGVVQRKGGEILAVIENDDGIVLCLPPQQLEVLPPPPPKLELDFSDLEKK